MGMGMGMQMGLNTWIDGKSTYRGETPKSCRSNRKSSNPNRAHPTTPALTAAALPLPLKPVAAEATWVEAVSETVSEWVSEWVSESVSQSVSEWVRQWVSEWVSEWVRQWVSGWVGEWVSEWVTWVEAELDAPTAWLRETFTFVLA